MTSASPSSESSLPPDVLDQHQKAIKLLLPLVRKLLGLTDGQPLTEEGVAKRWEGLPSGDSEVITPHAIACAAFLMGGMEVYVVERELRERPSLPLPEGGGFVMPVVRHLIVGGLIVRESSVRSFGPTGIEVSGPQLHAAGEGSDPMAQLSLRRVGDPADATRGVGALGATLARLTPEGGIPITPPPPTAP